MTRKRSTTLPLGTISEGTLRPEDLIPAYLDALESIRLTAHERKQVASIRREFEQTQALKPEEEVTDPLNADLIDELANYLEAHCPDYAYFGTLEGDGACFGVRANIEQLQEDAVDHDRYLSATDSRTRYANVVKVNAGDAFPTPRPGQPTITHLMEVNDHGNVTLYRRAGTRWIEVWGVV